jgi:hypothetical protein
LTIDLREDDLREIALRDKAPTSTLDTLEKIETVLSEHGVIVFSTPTVGVRLAR